jgi:arginine decarboxylase
LNAPGAPAGVAITVRTGSGTGPTSLAAFDHALSGAGVADFNLLALSSVIPPGSTVTLVNGASDPVAGEHGDRLYCVLSTAYAVEPGQTVWAGLGWAVDPASGRGLFVEHAAANEDELESTIAASLADLVKRRGGGYDEVRSIATSATYDDRPACAVAVAAYEVQGWGRG